MALRKIEGKRARKAIGFHNPRFHERVMDRKRKKGRHWLRFPFMVFHTNRWQVLIPRIDVTIPFQAHLEYHHTLWSRLSGAEAIHVRGRPDIFVTPGHPIPIEVNKRYMRSTVYAGSFHRASRGSPTGFLRIAPVTIELMKREILRSVGSSLPSAVPLMAPLVSEDFRRRRPERTFSETPQSALAGEIQEIRQVFLTAKREVEERIEDTLRRVHTGGKKIQDLEAISERVYDNIVRKVRLEREKRGR